MRSCAIQLLACLSLQAHVLADDVPQPAVVQVSQAAVRSGPGSEFYETERLAEGTEVEVYRITPQGWCSIRPPEGSFSYVPFDSVRPTGIPRIVKTIATGVTTRVGSRLSSKSNVAYITLELGEPLQTLGNPIQLGSSGKRWYKVAPPAGEFRWIRQQDLAFTPPAGLPVTPNASPTPTASPVLPMTSTPQPHAEQPAVATNQVDDDASEEAGPVEATAKTSLPLKPLRSLQGQMVTEPIPAPSPSSAVQTVSYESSASEEGTSPASRPAAVDSPEGTWTVVSSRQTASDPQPALETEASSLPAPSQRLADLELTLSRIVTRPIEVWDLTEVRDRTAQILAATQDAAAYRQAKTLAQRIDQFIVLQQRHYDLASASEENLGDPISLSQIVAAGPSVETEDSGALMLAPPAPPQMTPAVASNYSGMGWLVPVITSRQDIPRFALTDADGRIVSFVTPSPGMNLHRYQRRRVGIVGRLTQRTPRDAQHLLAERVVLLEQPQPSTRMRY